eukprot:scaffold46562_cov20-Prasinocladus_malaysianus.AAC.1
MEVEKRNRREIGENLTPKQTVHAGGAHDNITFITKQTSKLAALLVHLSVGCNVGKLLYFFITYSNSSCWMKPEGTMSGLPACSSRGPQQIGPGRLCSYGQWASGARLQVGLHA